MAPKEDWTLHRPRNAPILNPYIAYTESVLKALEKGLGDKTAQTLTPGKLVKKGKDRPGISELEEKYTLKEDQVERYQDEWSALDDQVGFLAARAADDSNLVTGEFEELRDSVVEITRSVPDDPTPSRQLDAVNAIDKAVGDAVDKVWVAYAALEGKSQEVPSQWSGGGGGSGGGSPYFPGLTDTGSAYSDDSAEPIGEGEKATVQDMYQYLIEKYDLTPEQAAGILGNLQVESGFDTGAYNPNEGAIGLAQWLGGRRENLEAFAAGREGGVTSWENQIDFMMHELNTSESGAYNRLKSTSSAGEAAAVFDQYYERSSGEARGKRVANAEAIAASMVAV
ncbi:phage tail tip lysozyme [Nocardia sp. NPDC024068]|uniref:phage tail tip lysozyme n=1 Tax=Nocardia sp. NPDC024068 TaxID=3157197 RepID=UPI0033CEA428